MRRGLLVVAALTAVGCDTSTDLNANYVPPTSSILVEPQFFLHDVACSNAPGSMQSYVATLVDITDPERGSFTLPSSPPTPCANNVSFQYIGIGDTTVAGDIQHVYEAFIDGYEQPIEDLLPLGGASSGSRVMTVPPAMATVVLPRWTGSCGTEQGAAVTATPEQVVPFEVCEPLVDSGSNTATSLVVDPEGALGSYACLDTTGGSGDSGGTIASFDVTSSNGIASYVGVPCDGTTTLTYAAGIVGGTLYTFQVSAYDVGDNLVAAASCSVVAEAGTEVHASCEPLTSSGAIRIEPSALPGTTGLSCVTDVDPGLPNEFKGSTFPCAQGARIAPLDPGFHEVDVAATMGDTLLSFTCNAEVVIGATATATCTLQ